MSKRAEVNRFAVFAVLSFLVVGAIIVPGLFPHRAERLKQRASTFHVEESRNDAER